MFSDLPGVVTPEPQVIITQEVLTPESSHSNAGIPPFILHEEGEEQRYSTV